MSGRILLADGIPVLRAGARAVLERAGFVVDEARDLESALAGLTAEPEIVMVDLLLPPHGGVDAVARLSRRSAATLVVWASSIAPETAVAAITAGARGFLPKHVTGDALVRSVCGIVRGEAAVPRYLVPSLVDALHGLDRREAARRRAELLSAREREVLTLVARGARNRDVAAALAISEFTVKRHVQNILTKLDVPSRAAASSAYRFAFGNNAAVEVQGAA